MKALSASALALLLSLPSLAHAQAWSGAEQATVDALSWLHWGQWFESGLLVVLIICADDIIIGPCTVDITDLKAWILSEDSFPFNFIYRIYLITSPLFFMEPEAPVIETAIPLDPLGQYSWIPDTYLITIDFEFLNPIAVVVRQLEMLGMAYIFALYGLRRYRNFAGSGD